MKNRCIFIVALFTLTSSSEVMALTETSVREVEAKSSRDPYALKYGATLGLQVPTGLLLELNYRPYRRFSFGIGGGGLKLWDLLLDGGAQQNGVTNTVSMTAFEGRARWHVSEGAFFIGLAGGHQTLSVTGINGNLSASGSLSRFYATPHLGWMWIMNSGLTLGIELGLQVPIGSTDIAFTGVGARTSARLARDIEPGTSYLVPYINLIKIGYSF